MGNAISAILGLAFTLLCGTAQAATISSVGTIAGDTSSGTGIVHSGLGGSVAVSHGAYSNEVTTPYSEWIWAGGGSAANFVHTFDLTGFDLSTVTVAGRWGVDNEGDILLNGMLIASLTGEVTGHFSSLHDYGTSLTPIFVPGVNTLTFEMRDLGAPAAFRATAVVTADEVVVPLPAGALLLLTGIGAFGFARRKRTT